MSQSPYGRRGRFGLLVPPRNTTVEPEIMQLLPKDVTLHVARFPGSVEHDTSVGLKERLLGYNHDLMTEPNPFSGADLTAVGMAVTGSSYLVGISAEEIILDKLRKLAPQATTSARAIVHLLRRLQAQRIGLVLPYPAWLATLAENYWQSSGFEIVSRVTVANVISIYEIDTNSVLDAVRQLPTEKLDAVLLSGTGMATLPAIKILSNSDTPVISSNLALSWWLEQAISAETLPSVENQAATLISKWLD